MKRNLLSVAIGCALLLVGVVGCDDNKQPEKDAVPPAASAAQQASPDTPKHKPEEKQRDPESIINEKMGIYIECYNDMDSTIYTSIKSYSAWLADPRTGPTGKEQYVSGIIDIDVPYNKCQKNITAVSALKPELAPIDKLAVPYINSVIDMKKIISKMNKYYQQQDYKDDNFAQGKALHAEFLKALTTFEPASEAFSAAIHEVNNRRQEEQLKKIEEQEGKSANYYSLSIMLNSKKINQMLEPDKFDTDSAMKQVKALGEQIEQLKSKLAEAQMSNTTFVDAAEQYLLAAKNRVRRVRDNTPLDDGEAVLMRSAPQMVDGSFAKLMSSYNSMVSWFNSSHG